MIKMEKYVEKLNALCTMYNVEKMYLFGSAVNSNFNDKSDIDLLVKFKPIELALLVTSLFYSIKKNNLT